MTENLENIKEINRNLKITVQKLVAELADCSVGLVSMVWKGHRENQRVIDATHFVIRKLNEMRYEWNSLDHCQRIKISGPDD